MRFLKHGLAIVLPFVIVYVVFKWLWNVIDTFFYPWTSWICGKLALDVSNKYIMTILDLFFLFLSVFLVFLIGRISSNGRFRNFFNTIETLFLKLPLVKTVYGISSKFSKALFSKDSVSFKKVVLVEFPNSETKVLGFLVGYDRRSRIGEERALVFVPTMPNPTTGFLFFLDPHSLTFLDISVEEGLKVVFSGGVYLLEE